MSDIVIKAENIGKLYKLGEIGTGTLSHDLNRWWASMRGKEDPLAKIGQTNDRTQKGESDYVWALKDINFEVREGEVLGIIGRNGAGKSTLLKILSKVTMPTVGQIKVKGRIASLLEVGTGFHPELTGRENIFLNGAILGMTRGEIRQKFDEIVDFAGVERYIDTPVKRYSSGMYVRLAFAVAAFLEPEILIIDEVLAVGDVDFQNKCLGRMQEISKSGRTIIFVSHNLGAISSLTSSAIVMYDGQLAYCGHTSEAINYYNSNVLLSNIMHYNLVGLKRKWLGSGEIFIKSVYFEKSSTFKLGDDFQFYGTIISNEDVSAFRISLTVYSNDGNPVGSVFGRDTLSIKKGDERKFKVTLRNPNLAIGQYYIGLSVGRGNYKVGHIDFDVVNNVLYFEYISDASNVPKWESSWGNIIFSNLENSLIYEQD
jgi:lipopolysaccharide transport system ATP-binding protein